MVKAAVDTTLDASVGAGYTAFERTMKDWQSSLIRWRCGLSAPERARLEQVATRFYLPPNEVEEMIAAGHDTLRRNAMLRAFLSSL